MTMTKFIPYMMVLLIIISTSNNISFLYNTITTFDAGSKGKDAVTISGKRLSGLKAALPENSIVSALFAPPGKILTLDDSIILKYYYMQYWLCPIIIATINDLDQYVVLDMQSNSPFILSDPEYKLIKDYNNGVYLLLKHSFTNNTKSAPALQKNQSVHTSTAGKEAGNSTIGLKQQ